MMAIPQPDVCICGHTYLQHHANGTCVVCDCKQFVKMIEVHPEGRVSLVGWDDAKKQYVKMEDVRPEGQAVQELPATIELRRFNNNFEWFMNAAWPKVAQTMAELTITLNELNRILAPFLPKVADLTSRAKT